MSYYTYFGLGILLLYLIRRFFNSPKCCITKDLKGKIVIVTGSSAGIGKSTAFDLLYKGATVIFACRDEKKTNRILSELEPEYLKNAHFIKLDLCNFDSINNFAQEFRKKFKKIDILINNAGTLEPSFLLSDNGVEKTFQTNHLGHMVLTFLLLDLIDKDEGRIIHVASLMHDYSLYTLKNLQEQQQNPFFNADKDNFTLVKGYLVYSNTKLAIIYFCQYLTEEILNTTNIKTMTLHPGVVNTEITRFLVEYPFWLKYPLYFGFYTIFQIFSKTCEIGAQTTLYLCYEEHNKLENGSYYVSCARRNLSSFAKDENLRKELINYSWQLIDLISADKFKVPRGL